MGRKVPQQQRAMNELLPTSIVLVEGRSFTITSTNNGKHQYKSMAEVIEPAELAGATLFDSFVIGSDTDPQALEEATMMASFGMQRVTSMFDAIGVDVRGEDEETFAEKYIGARYCASVLLATQAALNKDGSPNAYAGQEQNQVKRYFKVGEREPMIISDGKPASASTGTPAKATPAKVTPIQPAAPAAPKAAPKATPAAAPKKAAPNAAAGKIKCAAPECDFEGTVADFPGHVAEAHPE